MGFGGCYSIAFADSDGLVHVYLNFSSDIYDINI